MTQETDKPVTILGGKEKPIQQPVEPTKIVGASQIRPVTILEPRPKS